MTIDMFARCDRLIDYGLLLDHSEEANIDNLALEGHTVTRLWCCDGGQPV